MKIFYFTATGNSLYVAKKIGGELHSIPQVLKGKNFEFEDEAIGIVYPCYGFGLPRAVEEFLSKVKLKANYLFAVMTYGNTAGTGLDFLEKTASKYGIGFNYTNEILMIDNYLPVFETGKQLALEESKNIEPNLYLIQSDINERKEQRKRRSFITNILTAPLRSYIARFVDSVDKNFSVGDNCTKCGTCAKSCPKCNIVIKQKPEYLHRCDNCMACINLCPETAIHVKNEKSLLRFKNSNIETKEIIAANNQF